MCYILGSNPPLTMKKFLNGWGAKGIDKITQTSRFYSLFVIIAYKTEIRWSRKESKCLLKSQWLLSRGKLGLR